MAYGVRAKATSGGNMEDGHGYGDGEATLGDRLTAAREGAGLEQRAAVVHVHRAGHHERAEHDLQGLLF